VDKCILSLKRDKAADAKGLTAEHFQFVHPSIAAILTKLFDVMLVLGMVPTGFGCFVLPFS